MTLVRFKPDTEFDNTIIPKSYSEMLDNFFNDAVTTGVKANGFVPRVDVAELDKTYEIQVSLPGLKKDEVNIELEDSVLTISGERKTEKEESNKKYHLVETRFGSFSRSFTLPRNINRESIKASMKDGILNIEIEKDAEAVSKKIAVK